MTTTVGEAVINQLADTIGTTCYEKGFWEHPHPLIGQLNTKLLLISSEVTEAQDVLRKGREPADVTPDFIQGVMSLYQAEAFFEELADIIIRTLDIAGHFDWPLGETVVSKVETNRHRPHKHGKAF